MVGRICRTRCTLAARPLRAHPLTGHRRDQRNPNPRLAPQGINEINAGREKRPARLHKLAPGAAGAAEAAGAAPGSGPAPGAPRPLSLSPRAPAPRPLSPPELSPREAAKQEAAKQEAAKQVAASGTEELPPAHDGGGDGGSSGGVGGAGVGVGVSSDGGDVSGGGRGGGLFESLPPAAAAAAGGSDASRGLAPARDDCPNDRDPRRDSPQETGRAQERESLDSAVGSTHSSALQLQTRINESSFGALLVFVRRFRRFRGAAAAAARAGARAGAGRTVGCWCG